jgi:hypothetical protein
VEVDDDLGKQAKAEALVKAGLVNVFRRRRDGMITAIGPKGIQGRWIDQAREHRAREGKPWVLVVRRKGTRRPTATVDLHHFLELIHKEEGQA